MLIDCYSQIPTWIAMWEWIGNHGNDADWSTIHGHLLDFSRIGNWPVTTDAAREELAMLQTHSVNLAADIVVVLFASRSPRKKVRLMSIWICNEVIWDLFIIPHTHVHPWPATYYTGHSQVIISVEFSNKLQIVLLLKQKTCHLTVRNLVSSDGATNNLRGYAILKV